MTTLLALFAAISGQTVLNAIVWIVIAAIIYFVVDWGLGKIGLPEPFAKVAQVVLVLAVVLMLVNALLTLAGHPIVRW